MHRIKTFFLSITALTMMCLGQAYAMSPGVGPRRAFSGSDPHSRNTHLA